MTKECFIKDYDEKYLDLSKEQKEVYMKLHWHLQRENINSVIINMSVNDDSYTYEIRKDKEEFASPALALYKDNKLMFYHMYTRRFAICILEYLVSWHAIEGVQTKWQFSSK